MPKIKNFIINGEKYYTTNKIMLLDLINYFHYNDALFVLEYNHSICNKKNWEKIEIINNDKIEIVTMVGGG